MRNDLQPAQRRPVAKPLGLTPRKNTSLCGDGEANCLPNERVAVFVSASLFGIVVGFAIFLFVRRLLVVNKRKGNRISGPWLRDPFNAQDTDTDTIYSIAPSMKY